MPMMGKCFCLDLSSMWSLSVGELCTHGDSGVPLPGVPVLELCAWRTGVSM